MNHSPSIPLEFRQRALRMPEETLPGLEAQYAAISHVGTKLGVGPKTLRTSREVTQTALDFVQRAA